MANKKIRLKQL